MRHDSKGRNHQREERAIVVDIEILCGVGFIKRRVIVSMPEGTLKNKEVVTAFWFQFCDGADYGQHEP